ncbi:FliM/FliN family flagellar motor switch protein [Xanthomonas melonis]|uniref:FliM/FliN family flagellar motor switch protein n=1 Tax=Xanthomonas melonis TaxID=56456 RepID=UPI003EBEC944
MLEMRFTAWLGEWSASDGQLDAGVRIEIAVTEDAPDVVQPQVVTTRDGGLFGLRLCNGTASALGAVLMGLPGAADVKLCGYVGEQALGALVAALADTILVGASTPTHPVDPLRFLSRHGALCARMQWGDFQVELMADAVWCAAQDERVEPLQRPVLTARSQALRSQSVALHAQLILGEVELGEFSTLRVGELLVVETDAHAPVQLMSGSHVLAAARLVVADGQRALEVH